MVLGGIVQVLLMKDVARFARREDIDDGSLREAVVRAEAGSVDADLGGGLIKQRVARRGKGRSGGYRFIIAYRNGDRAVFLHGFAKSDEDNISADRLLGLREIGAALLDSTPQQIAAALNDGLLREVPNVQ